MEDYTETLYSDWRQSFAVKKLLYRTRSEHQDLVVFETERFGRVLALDGVIQTTEYDAFMYHEMLVHVPIFAHGTVQDVLIVGGGDGGSLCEVLKHPDLRPVLVEIDASVIEISQAWFPSLSVGAFQNPRSRIEIVDGCTFMRDSSEQFDVIIIDSTDPIGPAEGLFTSKFYADCRRRLRSGGVMVTQNGVPALQKQELMDSYQNLRASFADVGFYLTVVPTYVGGFMALGFAATDTTPRFTSLSLLQDRFARCTIPTAYYTPELHAASFALPKWIQNLIIQNNGTNGA